MRNLKLVSRKDVNLNPKKDPKLTVITALPEQEAAFALLVGCGNAEEMPTCQLVKVVPDIKESIEHMFTFSESTVTDFLAPVDKLKKIHYASAINAVLIASEAGGFFQLDLKSFGLGELFVAPSGISDFALSPDSRLLAVATKEETFIIFSFPNIEIVANIELAPQRLLDADEKLYQASVCWREDSQYIAINFYDGEKRRIKIFDDSGNPHSENEDSVSIVKDSLAWQSVDGLIGTVGKTPTDPQNITFLELNGLRRFEFEVFDKDENIADIIWNESADILAVQRETSVELWVRANYVWMLKKTIKSAEENSVASVKWERDNIYRFHVLWSSGLLSIYEVSFSYTTGNAGGSAIAASINGPTVNCTPFRDNCAPPPNCWSRIACTYNVAEVMVPEFWNGLSTVSSNGVLEFYQLGEDGFVKSSTAICVSKDTSLDFPNCYNWRWVNQSEICCIEFGVLQTFELTDIGFLESPSEAKVEAVLKSSLSVRAKLFEAVNQPDNGGSQFLIVQKLCGAMLFQELHNPKNVLLGRMPKTVTQFICLLTANVINETSVMVIGLDSSQKSLHVLNQSSSFKVLSDCLSIGSFQKYLLVTMIQGSLEVVSGDALENFCKDEGKPPLLDKTYSRKVEKGSHVVNCCWNRILEPSLTLQIVPRGNLETISPRPLLYDSMTVLLRDEKYNEVMLAMRRHRLDFNVLAEKVKSICSPESFEKDLRDRLQSLAEGTMDPHTLVLMLTELGDQHNDCIVLLKKVFDEKIAKNELSDKLVNPYLAITAKLKLLEEALRSSLISREDLSRDVVKARIKFLGFYCDNQELLYEAALGTYDLGLASQVADCLNKDPKEYVPVLDEYRAMSEMKARFTIDHSLKRYAKAAINLLDDSNSSDDEVMNYIQRHRVHTIAIQHLQTTKSSSSNLERTQHLMTKIYCSFGEELQSQRKFLEAALSYGRGNNHNKSAECFGLAGNWSCAVQAIQSNLEVNTSEKLFRKLIEDLDNIKEYSGAAQVAEKYLNDSLVAAMMYAKAKDWGSGFRTIGATETEEDHKKFERELASGYTHLLDQCETIQKEYVQYGTRLRTVVAIRAQAAVDGVGQEGDNFSDSESLASSTWSSRGSGVSSSLQSGSTRRSGKNARKLKRKLFSKKEGSRFEDVAIRIHLWELAVRITQEIKPEVESMIPVLWLSSQDSKAKQLAEIFDALMKTADTLISEIWVSLLPQQESLELKYCAPPPGWTSSWNSCSLLR